MQRRRKTSRSHVAIIIDFDNFAIDRKHQRIKITLTQLREHAAQYGTVVLAEAYLSPTGNSPTNVRKLTQARFHPIPCPLDGSGRDTVDHHIQEQTEQLLGHNTVDTVLIVSRDSDFRFLIPWATGIGKNVHMIDIREIANEDGLIKDALRNDFATSYSNVIAHLRRGMSVGEIKQRPAHDLVRHVILALWQIQNTRRPARLDFQALNGRVFQKLGRQWKTGNWQHEVGENDLKFHESRGGTWGHQKKQKRAEHCPPAYNEPQILSYHHNY